MGVVGAIMILATIMSATAFEAESPTYDILSYHLGLAGSRGNSTSYNIRATTTIQGYSDDASSASYIGDSGIYSEEQVIDNDPPNITINFPPDNYNTTNGTIQADITINDSLTVDNVSIYGSWGGWGIKATNSSGINNANYLFNLTIPEGIWAWAVEACDLSGNCGFSENRTIIVDNTAPQVSIISPANQSTIPTNDVNFVFNITDNIGIAYYEIILDGIVVDTITNVTNGTNNITRVLTNDQYNWSIVAYDYANNTAASGTYILTVLVLVPGGGGGPTVIEREEAINISQLFRAIDTEVIRSRNLKILMFLSILYFGWLIFAAKRDDKEKKKERDIFIREK